MSAAYSHLKELEIEDSTTSDAEQTKFSDQEISAIHSNVKAGKESKILPGLPNNSKMLFPGDQSLDKLFTRC